MLDVIFVILMVVMCRQLLSNVQEAKSLQETQAELEEVQADNKLYEMRLRDLEEPEKSVIFADVYATFESADPHVRHVRMIAGDNNAIEDLVLKPGSEDSVFDEFTGKLTALLSADPDTPVLVSIDDNDILYRDHIRFEEIFASLKDGYPNLFVKPARKGD